MAEIKSYVFGKTREATPEEEKQIRILVQNCPITVFQMLKKKLNERKLMIGISSIEETETSDSKDS